MGAPSLQYCDPRADFCQIIVELRLIDEPSHLDMVRRDSQNESVRHRLKRTERESRSSEWEVVECKRKAFGRLGYWLVRRRRPIRSGMRIGQAANGQKTDCEPSPNATRRSHQFGTPGWLHRAFSHSRE